jgi:hypothetical protein
MPYRREHQGIDLTSPELKNDQRAEIANEGSLFSRRDLIGFRRLMRQRNEA